MKPSNYIDYFPKPFLDDLVHNRCIPIIGAGFSKNADIPKNKKMLDWDELGRSFADDIKEYKYTNAIDAISAYTYEYSRTKLIEKLRDVLLVNNIKPGQTHKAFCELQFDLICTTNFEFLLEQGYALVEKPVTPIINEEQLSVSDYDDGVKILKLHGDLNHPNRLVATEEDYDRFLNDNPLLATYMSNLLITRTPLFIGYSLDDSDFRQIWQVIKSRLGTLRRQAYVLKINCSSYEKARFERRGVKVININGDPSNYATILRNVFIELRQYWSENYPNQVISDDSAQAQLALPIDVQNRLCFFSTPTKYLSFYKQYIFPIASKYGLIPIAGDDVISIGDNWMAKVSGLIDKAEFVVIDTDSKYTKMELGMIVNQKGMSKNILLVSSEEELLDFKQFLYIKKPQDLFENTDEFIEQVERWFAKVSESMQDIYDEEPKRLLNKKEYRASVISAITLLEVYLRNKIDQGSNLQSNNYYHSIYTSALKLEIINQDQFSQIKRWTHTRNQLVHSAASINGHEARAIVNGVNKIIQTLKD